MIATVLKHYLYDIGIGLFFDAVESNFATNTMSYVGEYLMAVDDSNNVVAYGKCTEQHGNLLVLDNGREECIVHLDLFRMHVTSDYMMGVLQQIDDEEYDEDVIDDT